MSAVGEIEARVTDERGAPLDSVAVTAKDAHGRINNSRALGGGRWLVGELPPGEYHVYAGQSAPPDAPIVQVSSGSHSVVDLVAARSNMEIQGRVVDERGTPIPDVSVRLKTLGEGIPDQGTVAVTDGDGKFRVGGLANHVYALRFWHPVAGTKELFGVAAGSNIDVVMSSPGSVAGIVRQPNGSPVTDFYLEFLGPGRGEMRTVHAPDGAWSVGDLSSGDWTLRIRTPAAAVTRSISVAPGAAVQGIDIELEEGVASPAAPARSGS
ncbi:MAG TPA: carboxypeptidase regulatory-like domain-containing protein [Polyangiaceae bacterium]|nr:carboxypeptidase regulatory-like domain-containing protein [Polyangiaceae bacterium]